MFEIVLRAEPGTSRDDAVRALRSFLKMALRSYGLRCTSASEIHSDEKLTPQIASESTQRAVDGN